MTFVAMTTVQKEVVHISSDLYGQILKKLKDTNGEFKTADEYVEFIVREMLANDSSDSFSGEDEDKIKDRLKSLGYI